MDRRLRSLELAVEAMQSQPTRTAGGTVSEAGRDACTGAMNVGKAPSVGAEKSFVKIGPKGILIPILPMVSEERQSQCSSHSGVNAEAKRIVNPQQAGKDGKTTFDTAKFVEDVKAQILQELQGGWRTELLNDVEAMLQNLSSPVSVGAVSPKEKQAMEELVKFAAGEVEALSLQVVELEKRRATLHEQVQALHTQVDRQESSRMQMEKLGRDMLEVQQELRRMDYTMPQRVSALIQQRNSISEMAVAIDSHMQRDHFYEMDEPQGSQADTAHFPGLPSSSQLLENSASHSGPGVEPGWFDGVLCPEPVADEVLPVLSQPPALGVTQEQAGGQQQQQQQPEDTDAEMARLAMSWKETHENMARGHMQPIRGPAPALVNLARSFPEVESHSFSAKQQQKSGLIQVLCGV